MVEYLFDGVLEKIFVLSVLFGLVFGKIFFPFRIHL